MWTHYIGRQIRRCNRNLLVPNLVLIGILLGSAFIARRYLENCLFGPFPMDHQALLEVKNPDDLDRYFVTLKSDRPPRGRGARKKTAESEEDSFLLIWDETNEERRLLLVKGPAGAPGEPVSGRLVRVPDALVEQLVKLEALHPQWRGLIVRTVRLDTAEFRWPGYLGLAFGVPLLLFAGWNVLRVVARALHPEQHPLVSQLARLGPPGQLAVSIQEEISRRAPHAPLGSAIETHSWLLRPTYFGLQVIPLNRIR